MSCANREQKKKVALVLNVSIGFEVKAKAADAYQFLHSLQKQEI
jgi:hypothetical protein